MNILMLLTFFFIKNYINCQQCENIRIRKNIRSLSSTELQSLINAFQILYDQGRLEGLSRIHTDHFDMIHDNPIFLPWHRHLIFQFESFLLEINPTLTLPYWDAATEFARPHRSVVFMNTHFGGNGDPFNNFCIRSGFLRGQRVSYPDNHCLRRRFSGAGNSIRSWESPSIITSIIQTSSSYDEFREALELSLHNSVHFAIGTTVGDISSAHSPNDALFYLHHANIDRIWARWQKSNENNLALFDGIQLHSDGSRLNINDSFLLPHYNIPVQETFNIAQNPYCYEYDEDSRPRGPSLAEMRLKNQLTQQTLIKYFPKLALGLSSSYDFDFAPTDEFNTNIKSPLPFPLNVPLQFFIKHKYNVSKVLNFQKKTRIFIQDLNRENFYSPYLLKNDE